MFCYEIRCPEADLQVFAVVVNWLHFEKMVDDPQLAVGGWIKEVNQRRGCAEIESERWQEKLIGERWRDEDVDEECFACCQIAKQLQSRQWRDYKSYIGNPCQLSYTSRGRPRHTRMVMRNARESAQESVERHNKVLHTWCQGAVHWCKLCT